MCGTGVAWGVTNGGQMGRRFEKSPLLREGGERTDREEARSAEQWRVTSAMRGVRHVGDNGRGRKKSHISVKMDSVRSGKNGSVAYGRSAALYGRNGVESSHVLLEPRLHEPFKERSLEAARLCLGRDDRGGELLRIAHQNSEPRAVRERYERRELSRLSRLVEDGRLEAHVDEAEVGGARHGAEDNVRRLEHDLLQISELAP